MALSSQTGFLSFSFWHAALFPLDFLPSAGGSDHLSPKAVPRCHRELFSIFCLLPSSVFLALQHCSDPPTPSTRPAAQLSGFGGDWLAELAERQGSDESLAFCSLASPPVSADEPGTGTEARAPGPGPWVPARRCRMSAVAHSDFSGSLAPGDGNKAGRQGASRNRPCRTKKRLLRPRLPTGRRGSE